MSYIRVLFIAASIGFGGYRYLHKSVTDEWQDSILKICALKSYPHRSIEAKGYLRALNLDSIGITSDSFNSIIKKLQSNFFKVRARIDDTDAKIKRNEVSELFPFPPNPDAAYINPFNYGFPQDIEVNVVGAIGLMAQEAYIKREGNKTYISYEDYVIFCDIRNKTPYFVMQGITKDTVRQVEHFHCESLRLAFENIPANYYFGKIGCRANAIITDVKPAAPRVVSGQKYCGYCEKSTFWKVFHKYITFLTNVYDAVYVCSGPLFLAHEGGGDCPSLKGYKRRPSHYFKVIFCKNSSGNYRMECYIIENKPMDEECPNLNQFIVSREELQSKAGLKFFPEIPNRMIKNRTPNPNAFVKPKPRQQRAPCRFSPTTGLAEPSSPRAGPSSSCTGPF